MGAEIIFIIPFLECGLELDQRKDLPSKGHPMFFLYIKGHSIILFYKLEFF